ANLLAVLLLGHSEVARRRTLADAVQQTGPEPAPAAVVGVDVQRAGAELEDALEHLDCLAQGAGAGERPVEFHSPAARSTRELDAREVLAHADLEIGEGLVV